jgi:hypothetical protein
MAEEIYRWRPVPLRQRCDRCREAATVSIDSLTLCGPCFLTETKRRLRMPDSSESQPGKVRAS